MEVLGAGPPVPITRGKMAVRIVAYSALGCTLWRHYTSSRTVPVLHALHARICTCG